MERIIQTATVGPLADALFAVEDSPPKKADAVIIFGNAAFGTMPHIELAVRTAVETIDSSLILITGGASTDKMRGQGTTEADIARSWLPQKLDAPVVLDRLAMNTKENCNNLAPMLAGKKSIVAVVGNLHGPRVEFTLLHSLRQAGCGHDVNVSFATYHHPNITRESEARRIVDYGCCGDLDWGRKTGLMMSIFDAAGVLRPTREYRDFRQAQFLRVASAR